MASGRLALSLSALLLLAETSSAVALAPDARPPSGASGVDDPGLILVVVVIPVVLLALIWMGYIFWLIFHEGENGGSGSPASPADRRRPPPDGRRKPGARMRRLPRWGSISRDVDFAPPPEMAESSLGQR